MKTSLNCDLNNQTGLVSLWWNVLKDDYFIKSFLFNEFDESPINQLKSIDISVGEFLVSSSNLVEFWKLNRHLISEFNISENLKNLYKNIPSYEEAINQKLALNENEVQAKLNSLGFIRKLKNTQITNVAKISNLSGSADFSVPGAGKTTEALALFLLNKSGPNHKCLIVCPINAFNAWEEEVPGCLGREFSSVILTGDANNIKKQLDKSGHFFVINYEKLR